MGPRALAASIYASTGAIASLGLTLLPSAPARAQQVTFIGPTNGAWSNPLNWDPQVVPDDPGGGSFDVVIVGRNPVLDIDARIQTLSFDGQNLTGDGDLEITDLFAWGSGNLATTGTTRALGGIQISGASSLRRGTLENLADALLEADLSFNQAARLLNPEGSSFDMAGDHVIRLSSGDVGTFVNGGLFEKTAGTGTGRIETTFVNDGRLEVSSGSLTLLDAEGDGVFHVAEGSRLSIGGHSGPDARIEGGGSVSFIGGEFAGTLDVSGGIFSTFGETDVTGSVVDLGPFLDLQGGTLRFDVGDLEVARVTLGAQSRLDLVGSLRVTDTFEFLGGSHGGDGLTTATAGFLLDGFSSGLQGSRTLVNEGVGIWNPAGLSIGPDAVLHNAAGAVIEARMANSQGTISGEGLLRNDGSLIVTSETTFGEANVRSRFENHGLVDIQAGDLFLRGSGSSSGIFRVAEGSLLSFGPESGVGGHLLTETARIESTGDLFFNLSQIEMRGTLDSRGTTSVRGSAHFLGPVVSLGDFSVAGTAIFDSGIAPGTLDVFSGSLDVAGVVDVAGATTWSGGTMIGTGTTRSAGLLSLSGTRTRTLDGRTLVASGGLAWLGGTVLLENGALLVVPEGDDAELTHSVFAPLPQMASADGTGVFRNAGSMRQVPGTSHRISATFENTGSFEVLGSIEIRGEGSSSGLVYVAPDATLRFSDTPDFSDPLFVFEPGSELRSEGTLLFEGNTDVAGLYDAVSTRVTGFPGGSVRFQGPSPHLGMVSTGGGALQISSDATASSVDLDGGVLEVIGGSLTATESFSALNTSISLEDGTLASPNGFFLNVSFVSGTGVLEGDVNLQSITLTPGARFGGDPIGSLMLIGDLEMGGAGRLTLDVGEDRHDRIDVAGQLLLDGALSVSVLDGTPVDPITVVEAGEGLTGAFANVASGERLVSSDGLFSFQVSYGAGSAFAPNAIVLSAFTLVPEPASATLFMAGLALLALRGRAGGMRCRVYRPASSSRRSIR